MGFSSVRKFAKEHRNRFAAWRQCRGIEQQNPVLVYQMGKVGSTTVVNTIKALQPSTPVVHVHTLTNQGITQAKSKSRLNFEFVIPEHLFLSMFLNRRLDAEKFPCRIIALTREPVARAVSFVFENWKKKAPGAKANGKLDAGLMQEALDKLLSGENGISDPTMWFDNELKTVFGIDIFSKPFDFKRGFSIFSHGLVSLLLMRMEDLNRSLPTALSEFLSVDVTSMPQVGSNRGSLKWYADSLAEFTASYQVPEELLGKIQNTRYFRHFYSQGAGQ